jgi:hypothetical protein
VVYIAYENHQNGDFKPYIIKSSDKGKSWVNVAGNLPERGGVYALAEDHINKNLIFAGTEFGLYFTNIGGEKWIKLNVGLPTIMVRDLAFQKQTDDLVMGTFGRSIYVLDDYSPLRVATPEMLQKESAVFPVKNALSYLPYSPGGDLGANYFSAPNPPVGAAITFNLKDAIRTRAQERQQKERAAFQKGDDPGYPTPEVLRAEAQEEAPAVILSIADASGKVVRRIDAPATRGIHRVVWDLRATGPNLPAAAPAGAGGGGRGGFGGGGGGGRGGAGGAGGGGAGAAPIIDEEAMAAMGFGGRGGAAPLAVPGKYTVTLAKRQNGVVTPLEGSQAFEVVPEGMSTREDRTALAAFQDKLNALQKAMTATQEAATEAGQRLSAIRRAIDATPSLSPKLREECLKLERNLADINLALSGDRVWRSHNEASPASISEHLQSAASPTRTTTGRPTKTAMEQYQIASDALAAEIPKLRKLMETDIKALEKQLDAAGAPPTPGRLPEWKGK